MLDIAVVWNGDETEGERILHPLRAFMQPFEDSIKSKSYIDEQREGSIHHPMATTQAAGAAGIWSASTRASSMSSRSRSSAPRFSGITMMYWHGPWCSQPHDNAFGFRRVGFNTGCIRIGRKTVRARTRFDGSRISSPCCSPIRAAQCTLTIWKTKATRGRAAYGDNYDRLATIKRKDDPANFFRINPNIKQNIKP